MKFLIDECLPPELTEAARKRGHQASFVPWLGKSGLKDWDLAPLAIDNGMVLVTNNSKDFRGDKGRPGFTTKEQIHPGLVCLNCDPRLRDRGTLAQLFEIALDEIGDAQDLINTVIEISLDGDEAEVRRYTAPELT
jgi:predicted nuclease of predicted toxin-antitoxin system